MDTKEILEKYLESEEGKAIKTLIAYTIRKTPTEKDDLVLDNIDDAVDVIKASIDDMADYLPTDSDAKKAGIVILERIALTTKTKWDDRAVALAKKIVK